MKVIPETCGAH